ncbi:MAG: hypothetical protein U1E76_05935 [Planctomycetota bacterium]
MAPPQARITYGALHEQHVARALYQHGLRAGEVLAILSTNPPRVRDRLAGVVSLVVATTTTINPLATCRKRS